MIWTAILDSNGTLTGVHPGIKVGTPLSFDVDADRAVDAMEEARRKMKEDDDVMRLVFRIRETFGSSLVSSGTNLPPKKRVSRGSYRRSEGVVVPPPTPKPPAPSPVPTYRLTPLIQTTVVTPVVQSDPPGSRTPILLELEILTQVQKNWQNLPNVGRFTNWLDQRIVELKIAGLENRKS